MLTFYHAPWSRGSAILWLLEELGADYELKLVDIRAEGGAPEAYRAIHPHRKVPAIVHEGVVVTERAAIAIHLADAFPAAGLAPAIGDPDRAPYLKMLVYHDAVFDPCVAARAKGWDYAGNDFSFGLFDDMVAYLEKALSERPYAAADRFTAADVMMAAGIGYTMGLIKVLPERPAFLDYLARIGERPAWRRAQEKDRELAAGIPALQAMLD